MPENAVDLLRNFVFWLKSQIVEISHIFNEFSCAESVFRSY